jgi:hypothetical protein
MNPDWQYAIYYLDSRPGVRHLYLSRRNLAFTSAEPKGSWQTIEFTDYEQTLDDGHNVASLGICEKDGTIHMSWDLHSSSLHYRHSRVGLASDPDNAVWDATAFSGVLDLLPGLEESPEEVCGTSDSKLIFFRCIAYLPSFCLSAIEPGR